MRLKAAILSCCVIACAAATSTAQANHVSEQSSVTRLRQGINWHRQQTWYWQDIRLSHRVKTNYAERNTKSTAYLRWLAKRWSARRTIAKYNAMNVPHYNQWICIHRYEGAWNDHGAPYYGGLQMDLQFQRTYGWDALKKWGTADYWHPLTQMWVAERAFSGYNGNSGRGFHPWPSTARMCGLI